MRRVWVAANITAAWLGLADIGVAGPAEDDFSQRASASGVVRAIGFDAATEVANGVHPDGQFEASGSGFDSGTKASGGGSLRFTVPALSSANSSGSWRINFSDSPFNVQFGENEEFFVQWRQRFDTAMLANDYTADGGAGWKIIIIGEGDRPGQLEVGSCTELELVSNSYGHQGFPILYHACGAYRGFYEPYGTYDFKLQNAMPAPYCLYADVSKAGCFKYYANEWMTFQIRAKLGPRGTAMSSLEQQTLTGFTNSTVEMWMAREAQPSKLVSSWSGVVLRETVGREYGKVWLTPYNTSKSGNASFPVANTWYDELIISRNKVADPAVGVVRPAPPQNLTAR